jgi:hypothetical protein
LSVATGAHRLNVKRPVVIAVVVVLSRGATIDAGMLFRRLEESMTDRTIHDGIRATLSSRPGSVTIALERALFAKFPLPMCILQKNAALAAVDVSVHAAIPA